MKTTNFNVSNTAYQKLYFHLKIEEFFVSNQPTDISYISAFSTTVIVAEKNPILDKKKKCRGNTLRI